MSSQINHSSSLKKFIKTHADTPTKEKNKEYLGIVLTLVGWMLVSFYTVLFEDRETAGKDLNFFTMFVGFAFMHLGMFLSFAFICCFSLGVIPISKTGMKELVSFGRCEHQKLVFWRSLIAIIGFWCYSFSKIWTSVEDNSILYGTDPFWMMLCFIFVNKKIAKLSVIGSVLTIAGIFSAFEVDYELANSWPIRIANIEGAILGLVSGISLCIIILVTTTIVRTDSPLKVGLNHAFLGIIFSSLVAVSHIILGYDLVMPSSFEIMKMAFCGVLFSLALFCLLEAFLYTKSYLIASISSFFPFMLIVSEFLVHGDVVDSASFINCLIITLGGICIIIGEKTVSHKHTTN